MSGQTPMTNIKVGALIGVLCIGLAYVLYSFVYMPYLYVAPAPVAANYQNGQILSGSGVISMSMSPVGAVVVTPAPTPAPTVEPTPAPTVEATPGPTALPDGNIHGGAIVYYQAPTSTPGPVIHAENLKYLDSWNYYKCHGLYLEYDLKQNVQLKRGSTYKFNAKMQNLNGALDHTVVTLTATTLNKDSNLNILLFTLPVLDDERTVGQYEYLTVSKEITVPSMPGHYKLYVVVTCNNGASAEIMQEVTVI